MVAMTIAAVSIAVRSGAEVEEALARAAAAHAAGARLVEWRLDEMAAKPKAAIRLIAHSALPSIATCRSHDEGGSYEGTEHARAAFLVTLIAADRPPRYVDVELEAWLRRSHLRGRIEEALANARSMRDVHTDLILSVHDFRGRPRDLLQKVERMAAEPDCSVVKFAWQARSVRDNLEAFDLLSERTKPTIALCMGRFGLLSRLLAPKFGAFLTYVTDRPDEATAPGQPSLEDLRDVYRLERVGPATRLYGVVGWPAEHSEGPRVHNRGFADIGHDGLYVPLAVPPEYEHFKASVGAMLDHPRLGLGGLSVTVPHKENLVRFITESGGRIEPAAARIGAANTLTVGEDGSIECLNTDAPAAVGTLCAGLGIEPAGLADLRVAVLGAGGVARAVVAALASAGATVVIFNRTPARAEALANAFSGKRAQVVVGKPGVEGCERFDVIINCTPMGMAGGPAPDRSPLPDGVELDERVAVFDTVYIPARTPLVQHAEAAGARVIPGRNLFLRQAALQFSRWTGKQAPW
jgi:3-dehydroquinate dehydratase/shikimate dehydrogenase